MAARPLPPLFPARPLTRQHERFRIADDPSCWLTPRPVSPRSDWRGIALVIVAIVSVIAAMVLNVSIAQQAIR